MMNTLCSTLNQHTQSAHFNSTLYQHTPSALFLTHLASIIVWFTRSEEFLHDVILCSVRTVNGGTSDALITLQTANDICNEKKMRNLQGMHTKIRHLQEIHVYCLIDHFVIFFCFLSLILSVLALSLPV